MKKVLIISYYFPPTNAIGGVRIGKLAKYLPEFGWDPIVLTVNKMGNPNSTLPIEIDEKNIIRTPSFTGYDWITHFSTPHKSILISNKQEHKTQINPKPRASKLSRFVNPIVTLPIIDKLLFDPVGWYRYAVRTGLDIIKQNNIDIIFSTYGPSLPHLIAAQLNKKSKIRWVAEFRDLWSLNPYTRQTQPFHFLEKRWEKCTMKYCDLLISKSELEAEQLGNFHSKRTIVIPNGFDEDDFVDNVSLTLKFSITYTGNIYPGKRDPSPLFQALAELKQQGKCNGDDIGVHFWGENVRENIVPLLEKYDIRDLVKFGGNIPYKESILRQRESTILLLLSWDNPKDGGTIPGKIYEYIAAERPILALAYKGGEIDKLLKKTGCGILVNEVSEIRNVLMKWLMEFKNNRKITSFYNPDKNYIKKYTRREQAREVAELFEKIHLNIT